MKIDENLARQLLKKYPLPEQVLKHVEKVKDISVKIGQKLVAHGKKVDIDFLKAAALLHDIGHFEINYEAGSNINQALHAPAGQKILEKEGFPELAAIAGAHSVTDSNKEEAQKIGFPQPTKLPDRIEAKIVCVADKLRGGEPESDVENWFKNYWDRYFKNCPEVGERIKQRTLDFVRELRGKGWDGQY